MSRNEDLSDFSPRIGINKGDTGTDRCCSPTNSVSDSVDYDDIIITELCSPEAAVGDCKNTLEPHYLLSASCTEFPSSDRSDIYAQNNKFSVEATTSSVIACSPSDSVSTQPNEAEILKTSLQSFGSDGVSAITTPLHSCIDPCATTSCVEGNTAVAGRSFVSRIKSNVSQSEAEILKHTLQSYGGTTTPTSNNHIENKNSQRLTLPGVGCANRSVHSSSPNFTESENVKNTLQAYGDAGVSYPYQLPSAQKGNPTTSSSSIPPAVLFRFSAPPPSHRAFSSTAVPVAAAGMGPLTVSTPCPNTAPACDVEEARLHEEHEDTYLPVAIKAAEPEMVAIPMMKADDDDDCLGRRLLKQRIKLLWLTLLLVSSAAAISIGGYCTAQSCRGTHSTIPHRELVGILKNVERLVGSDALNNNNDGSSSSNNPYHQALDWITHDDPMALTPEDPTFVQRYLLAYVYFATSVQHDWSGGCGRPAQGESVDCQYACWDDQGIGDPQSVPYKRWLSSASECFWAGVFCDEVGQVRSMKLEDVTMTGTFPKGIVNFPFLQSVVISHSQLGGPLPDNIADMKHLVDLNLNNNTFTGSIPDAWYKSRSLRYINLLGNRITGPITKDIGKLKDMKQLSLTNNALTGTLPNEIGDMYSLNAFSVGHNNIRETIPTSFGKLRHLIALDLYENQLTGTIPTEIGLLKSLNEIRAQSNLLHGEFPEEVYNCTSLGWIDLYDNKLSGNLTSSIGSLTNLVDLLLSRNNFGGTVPTELGLLTKLWTISLSGNNFVGSIPVQLCALRSPFQLTDLEADCAVPPTGGSPEIQCAPGCCTQCCEDSGPVSCYSSASFH